jgi:pyruvate-formate lyase-activating enzyme
MVVGSPIGSDRVDLNHGLHFTGGEPFMNFDLLLRLVKIADELGNPSTFVETN